METFDELYYTDTYAREFDARVTSCEPAEGGFAIALDRTAFYPTGGGQPGDRGTLVPADAPAPAPAAEGAQEAAPAEAPGTVHVREAVPGA